MKTKVIHYSPFPDGRGSGGICFQFAPNRVTGDRKKVTCRNCRKKMGKK
jgi:hypothetical protein